MKFDLKKACKNCPFANTIHRITFSCKERARSIEELAYREGFVCHLHSEHVEETEHIEGGYVFRSDGTSQHCFGAIAMYVKEGGANIPWENLSSKQQDRWWDRADPVSLASAFDDEEAFIMANGN
jgi:hypothetical protein